MQNDAPIQLHQYRDFGQIISATFQFLKQNWRPLLRAIAVICLPASVIAGFLIGSSLGDLQQMSLTASETLDPMAFTNATSNLLPMFIGYMLMFLVFVILIAIVYEYMGAYHRGEHHGITTADLWNRSIGHFGSYIGLFFIQAILMGIGFLLCILPGIYAMVVLSLTFMVYAIERKGVFDSIKRSNELIRDRWWETFGLIIVVGLIQGVITYALMLPTMIISFVVGFNSIMESSNGGGQPDLGWYPLFMAITTVLNMLISILTYPIMIVAMGLKYFSIVEQKEGTSIRQKIEGFEQA